VSIERCVREVAIGQVDLAPARLGVLLTAQSTLG
jgi:hypothetical protein